MQVSHRIALTGTVLWGAGVAAIPAAGQTMDLSVAIPRMTVAEYHQPYVAIWIEKAGSPARTLSVWYDYDKPRNEGNKWLNEVRGWWRASGRTMTFPADGITGATRAPGDQKISFTAGKGPLGPLSAGDYVLVVEAAREVGGREAVRLPFAWPPKPGAVVRAAGKTELGAVTLGFRK